MARVALHPGITGRIPAELRVVAMTASDRWLTYSEAAALLGLTTESLRQRARREMWRKQLANDGRALVLVPVDTGRNPPGDAPSDTGGDAAVTRPVKRPDPDAVSIMQARLLEMENRAAEMRKDVERERAERLQERDRAEKLVGEVADLARQLARVTEEAAGRERGLQQQLTTAENNLIAMTAKANAPPRRWWQRRAG